MFNSKFKGNTHGRKRDIISINSIFISLYMMTSVTETDIRGMYNKLYLTVNT